MGSVKYPADVAKSLMAMEDLNIHARVTGIAWRKMVERELPFGALRRLSQRQYVDDGEWFKAVRSVTQAEEDFKERKDLRGGGSSGTAGAKKGNSQIRCQRVAAKCVNKQYTAKEKADCQKKKAGERMVKKERSVAPLGEVKHTVCADAHKGVDQKVVNKRKSDNECTRCAIQNYAGKYF